MSSMTQASPDSILLPVFGELIITAVVQLCTLTLIYGIFILLFSQTTVMYLKKKQANRTQNWMFAASATSFLIATMCEIVQLAITGILIHSALVGYQGLSLFEKRELINGQLKKPKLVLYWGRNAEVIISDGIVVWRVIVLLQCRKWLKILPLVLFLASLASYFIFLIFGSAGADLNHGFVNNISAAADALSLATNIISTALIGYIYWLHRKDMLAGLGRHQITQAERVLSLLMESGIVFCLCQAIQFTINFTFPTVDGSTAALYASDILGMAYLGFSAIYPTLVISLVNRHQTFNHVWSTNTLSPRISHDTNTQHITTIQFAHLNSATSSETSQQVEKNNNIQGA